MRKGKCQIVKDAISENDALNSGDNAQSTETSKTFGKKLKLLCNPQRLPEPITPRTEEYRESDETPEIKRELKAYYRKQKYKKPSKKRRT